MPRPKITRVALDRDDGTRIVLDSPKDCEAWEQMTNTQAVTAHIRGVSFEPLPWREEKIDADLLAEIAEFDLDDQIENRDLDAKGLLRVVKGWCERARRLRARGGGE